MGCVVVAASPGPFGVLCALATLGLALIAVLVQAACDTVAVMHTRPCPPSRLARLLVGCLLLLAVCGLFVALAN